MQICNLLDVKAERMKKGNSKLYNVLIFDLPAGENGTCRQTCNRCYALKAERMYPRTRTWRNDNYDLVINHTDYWIQLMRDQLDKTKLKTVRIHSSGDFFAQWYLDLWYEIISGYPEISFYAYTKNMDIIDFSNAPPNFNIIDSYIYIEGKRYKNYGDKSFIDWIFTKDSTFYLCPAAGGDGSIKCNRDCDYCVKGKKVVFRQH